MRNLFIRGITILVMCALSFISYATTNTDATLDLVPTGKGWGIKSPQAPKRVIAATIPQNGINFHGGYVMGTDPKNSPTTYVIWYGNWTGNKAASTINILSNFLRGVGASPYYNINSTYVDSAGSPVLPKVNFGCSTFDNYSQGKELTTSSVAAIVRNALATNKLPANIYGIYFVVASADVNLSGFCTQFCGWHTYTYMSGTGSIPYSFLGDVSRCPSACTAQSTTSPNDNVSADGIASVMAHELEEAITDPYISAWYDTSGYENADKCAWNFGAKSTASNGSQYNMNINGMNYLIQQNWVNANNGYCAQKFPA